MERPRAGPEHHWRDTHLRLEGPIVSALQSAFQSHWIKTYGEALTGAAQFHDARTGAVI